MAPQERIELPRAMTTGDNLMSLAPAELLERIQTRFRELGRFEQTLTLTYNGKKYLAKCDSQAFAVYRLVSRGHLPPGRPGWPVCLVTAEVMVDESSPPLPPEDEFSSGLNLAGWLELIEACSRGAPPE
jgi:hypothetical protein